MFFTFSGNGQVIGAESGRRGGYIARMTSPLINVTSDICLHFDYYVSEGARLDISMADPDATLFNRTRSVMNKLYCYLNPFPTSPPIEIGFIVLRHVANWHMSTLLHQNETRWQTLGEPILCVVGD